jgi:subtilisin family serine protease
MPTLQRLVLVLLALLLSVAPSARAQHEDATGGGENGEGGGKGENGENEQDDGPGQVLIRGDDWQQESARLWLRDRGYPITPVEEYPAFSIWLYDFDAGVLNDTDAATVRQNLDLMTSMQLIEEGEFNLPMTVEFGDGQTGSLWVSGMNKNQFDNQYGFSEIDQPSASAHASGAGVIVAIIDSGLIPGAGASRAYSLDRSYDWVHHSGLVQGIPASDTGDGYDSNGINGPDEGVGHGTFIASLIGGVAPLAKHLHMKVLNDEGACRLSFVVAALQACIYENVHVVNLSLVPRDPTGFLTFPISAVRDNGSIVIASAGNTATSVNPFSGSESALIQVGAVDSANAVWTSSPTNAAWVDVMAPGVSNLLTAPGSANSAVPAQWVIGEYGSTNGITAYAAASGTSFSAAFVTGAAAAFRSANPDLPTASVPAASIANAFRTRMLAADNNSTSAIKRLRAYEIVRIYPAVPNCERDIVRVGPNGQVCCRSQADIDAYNAQSILHLSPGYDVRRIRRADLDRDRHVDEVDLNLLGGLSPCN